MASLRTELADAKLFVPRLSGGNISAAVDKICDFFADGSGAGFVGDFLADVHGALAVKEFCLFVALKCVSGDLQSFRLWPSPIVAVVWMDFLLQQPAYHKFCQEALDGVTLAHDTRTSAGRSQNYAQTLARYREVYGCSPPADIWPAFLNDDLFNRFRRE